MAMQLFGQDPDVMRSAAARVAEAGADLIDLNMGCPVPKVCKTGAGAALLKDPDTAVAVARAAREGSGLPVTVKLRAEWATRSSRAGSSRRRASPASPSTRARQGAPQGPPDYDLAAQLVADAARCPVIVSGGMNDADHVRWVFEYTGADGDHARPRLAREPVAVRAGARHARRRARARRGPRGVGVGRRPRRGAPRARAARPLPAQVPPLVRRAPRRGAGVQDALQRAETLAEQRAVIAALRSGRRLSSAAPARCADAIAHYGPPCRGLFLSPDPTPGRRVMQKDVLLTPEGLEKLKDEIEYLSTVKRREVAERIKEAREFGDISENSEYDDAKNEQAMLEARIASLEEKLRSASVIDAAELSTPTSCASARSSRSRTVRQVAEVHDRGLHRGRPGREPALQRVAGRQGPARPQEGDTVKVQLPNGKARSSRSPRSTSA